MAIIGNFTTNGNAITGQVRTLTVSMKARLAKILSVHLALLLSRAKTAVVLRSHSIRCDAALLNRPVRMILVLAIKSPEVSYSGRRIIVPAL
uniref:hypothetical protein n=1 Tax=Neorhizobium sp. EC2-8 TaxID=3129230 RepID=UPI0031014B26